MGGRDGLASSPEVVVVSPPVVFVLVHSPIVGSDTWEPVAQQLRARGVAVVVPTLTDDGAQPFWRQHVTSVVAAVDGYRVAALVFVDAGLPPQGRSRLDQVRDEASEFAEELERLLADGRPFPYRNDQQLRPLVPDAQRRSRLIAGIRHLPPGYWTETIPPSPGWDSGPVGVLLLSSGYQATADTAEQRGWPSRRLDVDNHFHMLEDPGGAAEALDGLAQRLCHVANEFAADIARWADAQGDVRAVGLVGSYARGTASPDSDIDLIVVVDDVASRLASREWLDDFDAIPEPLVSSSGVTDHGGSDMRRVTILFTASLFALMMLAGTAVAMQPPGEPAQDLFACVEGSPVPGHPGAAGLVDATPLVGHLTGDTQPTAWNAVEHADPIKSSCAT